LETAYKYFNKLVEIDQNFYEDEIKEKLGYIHFRNRLWKEASELFEKINTKRARDIISLKIGRCYEKMKMFNEAFLYYKKSLEITKDFLWGLYYLGSIYIRTGRRDEGLKFLKLAVDKNSQNSEIIIKYCEELIKDIDEVDNAINILTKSLDTISENSEILILLAKSYEKKENYAKAVEILEEAMILKDFNTNPKRMLYLGLLYEKALNFNKAVGLYKSILNVNKDHIPSLCHLASILLHAKEFKRAMKYYKYALSINDNLVFAHFGIGKIYQGNGQVEDAMKCFNKVLELDSKNHKYY
jgi:tetratricopeptide (TPR) repeat protein